MPFKTTHSAAKGKGVVGMFGIDWALMELAGVIALCGVVPSAMALFEEHRQSVVMETTAMRGATRPGRARRGERDALRAYPGERFSHGAPEKL